MYGFLPHQVGTARPIAPESLDLSAPAGPARRSMSAAALADSGLLTAEPEVAVELGLAHPQITSVEQFEALSQPAADLVANGRLTKVFVDQRDPAAPQVSFVNSNYVRDGQTPAEAKYHHTFGQAVFAIPSRWTSSTGSPISRPGRSAISPG